MYIDKSLPRLPYTGVRLMIDECNEEIVIYPAAGKIIGNYPADFQIKEEADE